MLFADALVTWLADKLATSGFAAATRIVRGDAASRALVKAVESAADEVVARAPVTEESRESLRMALRERCAELDLAVDPTLRLLDALRLAIRAQIKPLADSTVTGTGRSYLAEIGVSDQWLLADLPLTVLRAIQKAAVTMPEIQQFVAQLNHDELVETISAAIPFHQAAALALPKKAVNTLPRDTSVFTGREAELDMLESAVAQLAAGGSSAVVIHALAGMGGVGKSALAIHLGHQRAQAFPDGRIFIDLHGFTEGEDPIEPAMALDMLLSALEVPAHKIPMTLDGRSGLWRSEAAGRQLLVILDNAASAAQVKPLLPGQPTVLVLVTSRRKLLDLEDSTRMELDTLPPSDAALLLSRITDGRVAENSADASELVRLCGYLPLAITLVGSRLKPPSQSSPQAVIQLLDSAGNRLSELRAGATSVEAVFDLSYNSLSKDQARLFRLLGLHPATDISLLAATAMNGKDIRHTRQQLQALVEQSMLSERDGRSRFHDLLREYARKKAGRGQAARSAVVRMTDYYVQNAYRADELLLPQRKRRTAPVPITDPPRASMADATTAREWIDSELQNLLAVARSATAEGASSAAWQIPLALAYYFWLGGKLATGLNALGHARSAAEAVANKQALADILLQTGLLLQTSGKLDDALTTYEEALGRYRRIGDPLGIANVRNNMGIVHRLKGDFEAMRAAHLEALAIFRTEGDRLGEADALYYLGSGYRLTGDWDAALNNHRAALEVYKQISHLAGYGNALGQFGAIHRFLGRYEEAIARYEEAMEVFKVLDSPIGQANMYNNIGAVLRIRGRYADARRQHEQAERLFHQVGNRGGEADAINNIGILYQHDHQYEEARACHERALAAYIDAQDLIGQGMALNHLGVVDRVQGQPFAAVARHSEALTIFSRAKSKRGTAQSYAERGKARQDIGETSAAVDDLVQAYAIFEGLGVPEAAEVKALLDALGGPA